MTTLTTKQTTPSENASASRTYSLTEVKEIQRLSSSFRGMVDGYTHWLAEEQLWYLPDKKELPIVTQAGTAYVRKYVEDLRRYPEVFPEEIAEAGELLEGLEERLQRQAQDIKGKIGRNEDD